MYSIGYKCAIHRDFLFSTGTGINKIYYINLKTIYLMYIVSLLYCVRFYNCILNYSIKWIYIYIYNIVLTTM
jgi:hypothetical protein